MGTIKLDRKFLGMDRMEKSEHRGNLGTGECGKLVG